MLIKKKNNTTYDNIITQQTLPNNQYLGNAHEYLHKFLKDITFKQNSYHHFVSNGKFALHDLIFFIAKKIGLCSVITTSFNISKDAARLFIKANDMHLFKSLTIFLNASKKANFASAIKIVEQKFPVIFTNIHAKIALIENENHKIVILTTGNLSTNNNIERGFIA